MSPLRRSLLVPPAEIVNLEQFVPESSTSTMHGRIDFLGLPFDLIDEKSVLDELSKVGTSDDFRYIVTPNVDHIVRTSYQPSLREYYDHAWFSLCDSKPVWLMSKGLAESLHHVTGSDLTVTVFKSVLRPGDVVSVIVADEKVVEDLRRSFPKITFYSHVPPPGLVGKPDAIQAAVDFLLAHPSRFIFLAVGAPQSEMIARSLSRRSEAKGVALCIGASLEFIIGRKRRAPRWMQLFSLEWLHRLITDPRRLWRRYLLSFMPLARLYLAEFRAGRLSLRSRR